MPRTRIGTRTIIGFAAVALALGSGVLTAGSGSAAPQQAATLDEFYGQQVRWESCASLDADGEALDDAVPNVECTRVVVPLDYADPDGKTARIALSRVRASGVKIGSLVMNPGGPGASGLGMVALGDDTPIAVQFDRVGLDPRGVGSSLPLVQCYTADEIDESRGQYNPDQTVAEANEETRRFVAACAERSGLDLLANVGTRDVVRDLDIIRAVLGDEKLSYFGQSYGTSIGTLYAEAYPDKVRAMVLDGAVDPSKPLLSGYGEGFANAFDDYAADCARAADCPLGNDPAMAGEERDNLLLPLIEAPASTSDGRGLSYTDGITGVHNLLYNSADWPVLTQALTELRAGRGDILLAVADWVYLRRADGTYGNRQEVIQAVLCVDEPVAAATDAEAPVDPCAIWPVPPTGMAHEVSVEGLPSVVVVSTTGDPATPYEQGVELARQLDAVLLTYEANQHGAALQGVSCIDDPVIAYLTELTVPEQGLVCPGR